MITIYGTRGCGFCKMAVEKCKKHRMPYEYKDASILKHYQELQEQNIDTKKMPHMFIDGDYIGTYHELIHYFHEQIQNGE